MHLFCVYRGISGYGWRFHSRRATGIIQHIEKRFLSFCELPLSFKTRSFFRLLWARSNFKANTWTILRNCTIFIMMTWSWVIFFNCDTMPCLWWSSICCIQVRHLSLDQYQWTDQWKWISLVAMDVLYIRLTYYTQNQQMWFPLSNRCFLRCYGPWMNRSPPVRWSILGLYF